ncbi:MAG: hypothetical protein HYY45_08775 [Deltaproteobacteria bacterium]|nr:hypothetical protein [Deltaproteobacteria bacterium]
MRHSEVINKAYEWDALESPTEEEIICLWRSLKAGGLAGDEAWYAIVTGIALDMAFARSKSLKRVEH